MAKQHPLAGVYAAALTPLTSSLEIDPAATGFLLGNLARAGCHGALLAGTTGEGQSLSLKARAALFQTAKIVKASHPTFKIMAGTSSTSLEDTVFLTRAAFDSGCDAVLVLPPYFLRNASEEGLFRWFRVVLARAVPSGGHLLGYHIPGVSGVPLSHTLLERLLESSKSFAGIKDSSADPKQAKEFCDRFGSRFAYFCGTDTILQDSLNWGGAGGITALANLFGADLRAVFDAHLAGRSDSAAHARLLAARAISERYSPASSTLKAVGYRYYGWPAWPVLPPLISLTKETLDKVGGELEAAKLVPAVPKPASGSA
jgi:4-hydroxy-tetrahydrodipicolinate synthase